MKRFFKGIAAGLMTLAVLACGGCEASETAGVFVDNQAKITVKKASVGSETSGDMTVAKNEHLKVTSNLDSGKVMITITNRNADPSLPSVEWEFEGKGETEYEVEPGNYQVKAAVTEKATGTIQIDVIQVEAPVEDGQNPIMNFIGSYQCERCSIDVQPDGMKGAKFLVHWGSSATEYTQWTMSGPLNTDTLTVDYTDCKKVTVDMGGENAPENEKVEYEGGTGTFTFSDGGELTLVWKDAKEDAGKDMVFDYVSAAE